MNTHCPCCSRFVGIEDTCPYCGYRGVTPRVWKRFRVLAVFMALLGILLLGLMSTCRELPLVRAGRISPMMNYARVRVAGRVLRNAFVGRDGDKVDYVSFCINDGTGEIRLSAYDDTARKLVDTGLLPGKGDLVEGDGLLRVTRGKAITLNMGRLTKVEGTKCP